MGRNPYIENRPNPEPHWFWGGLFLTPKLPSQLKEEWLAKLEQWDNERKELEDMNIKTMLTAEDEAKIINKERTRSERLQRLSHLEGTLDGTSKVSQDQFYTLLNLVREMIESA